MCLSLCLCAAGLNQMIFCAQRKRNFVCSYCTHLCIFTSSCVYLFKLSMTYGSVCWSCEVHAYSLCIQNAVINTTFVVTCVMKTNMTRGQGRRDRKSGYTCSESVIGIGLDEERSFCSFPPALCLAWIIICMLPYFHGREVLGAEMHSERCASSGSITVTTVYPTPGIFRRNWKQEVYIQETVPSSFMYTKLVRTFVLERAD